MVDLKNILYFNSTRNYTLAILDSLNSIKHWAKDENGDDTQKVVPISFGNYEKSIALEDIKPELIENGNYNFVPRLVLSFDGMTKVGERTTNKLQKISKRVVNESGDVMMNFGYNSVAYDFQFTLTLQARGMNEAFMITEQILPMFRPTYALSVKEYPLFDDMTDTVLQIEDPAFEILDTFEDTDVNIMNVTFGLNLRGNLYMPLQLVGSIETVKMLNHLWDNQDIRDSQLASQYEFDVCSEDGRVYNTSIERHYASPKLTINPIDEDIVESPCESDIRTVINTQTYIDITTEDDADITTEEIRN